jgi:flagellar biosynthesis chaperone FliJ
MELVEALESEKRICATWRKTAEANSEKLEKAQQRIVSWRTMKFRRKKPVFSSSPSWQSASHKTSCG